MFVIISVRWLNNADVDSEPPATISGILEKMITAAQAISCRSRRDTHGCEDAEDLAWIYQLWGECGSLSARYGQLFRRLLHIFETSYCRDFLVGDQDTIRRRLHECLNWGRTCEVEGCRWISHTCDGTFESDYKECPLLAKRDGNVTVSRSTAPLPRQAGEDGSLEVDFAHNPDPAGSHEQPPESTRSRNVDVSIVQPSYIPGSTEDRDISSSQHMASGDAHDASTSIHSPGTASDTSTAGSHTPQSTASHPSLVVDVAPCVLPVDSVAVPISPSPDRPDADEVSLSDSHVTENPSRDAGEPRMGDQDPSRGDIADPGAGTDAVLSTADALQVQQHEAVPLAATATETVSTGSSSAAHGTSNKIDAPDAAVSYPTTPAPLSMPSVPPPTSTVDSQPPASLGGPLLDPAGSSSMEIRSPAVTTVSRGHPQRDSSQDPLTSRVATGAEVLRAGHGLDAERVREESSGRPASSLFQGVRAVSRRGSEEFELAAREGRTGEDSGQDG